MSLLKIRHLFKAYPIESGLLRKQVAHVQALSDVSFEVQKSETLAIVGGSGCGKSTLAKIIAGLIPPDTGELLWEGKPLRSDNRRERARRVQMIFQDPYASLNPKLSIGTQLNGVLALTRPSATQTPSRVSGPCPEPSPGILRERVPDATTPLASARAVVAEGGVRAQCVGLLESVGLSADVLSHYPFQFSGGQRQRIAIARALALGPELLVADEPLSALDSTTQAQVLELLRQLKASRGLTLLFITHDLAVIENFADRVIVLQDGKIVEEGPVRQVLESPAHRYTQALLKAVPRVLC